MIGALFYATRKPQCLCNDPHCGAPHGSKRCRNRVENRDSFLCWECRTARDVKRNQLRGAEQTDVGDGREA